MAEFESSVIIPVFNQWDFTRNCLKTLAATTRDRNIEVIVIDNASTDATAKACPFLGSQLFGHSFRYARNESNINFGPASNMGARLANGNHLVFLNNDTELLPGWYQPLLDDFGAYPDIAATGPLLLYPANGVFGHTVQHLGVAVSPLLSVDHLHECIPAESPLARRRRFFQIITAACMMMPRNLFFEAGLFDEHFINGFEDVDLCARLCHMGRRMTVNPDARVVHHQSQTQGRHDHNDENMDYLAANSMKFLTPDLPALLNEDGLELEVNEWLCLRPGIRAAVRDRLDKTAGRLPFEELRKMLAIQPYWEKGWRTLLARPEAQEDFDALAKSWLKLLKSPDPASAAVEAAIRRGDPKNVTIWLNTMAVFAETFEKYVAKAKWFGAWLSKWGLKHVAAQCSAWLGKSSEFKRLKLEPFLKNFLAVAPRVGMPLSPLDKSAYAAWLHTVDLPARASKAAGIQNLAQSDNAPAFSILMPVYNPDPDFLRAALDSVLGQEYARWELCIADDASTTAETKNILEEYAAGDSRVRVSWRAANGNISAATNTALGMARYAYAALMDQDDLLASDALALMAASIAENPDGLLFYSDEDKITEYGGLEDPYLKNGKWDAELVITQNYICHLGVYRTDRLREIGGFREGYEGAQDHDMLLRYIDGQAQSRFIHVPHALYHWRMHAQSTAKNVLTKPQAVENGVRAAQDWLNKNSPGATVSLLNGTSMRRVNYPLPKKRPSVSIICDLGESAPTHVKKFADAWQSGTGYPHELVLLVAGQAPGACVNGNVRLAPYPEDCAGAERLRRAAEQAEADILGFVSPLLMPVSRNWLEELVSCLWRRETGACGGRVVRPDGMMEHSGWLADADGGLKPLFQGLNSRLKHWYGWNRLARCVDALDGLCLFTKKELFLAEGGLDSGMGNWAMRDYCLRLAARKLRIVWWPFAEFALRMAVRKQNANTAFQEKWSGRIEPAHPFMHIRCGIWELRV